MTVVSRGTSLVVPATAAEQASVVIDDFADPAAWSIVSGITTAPAAYTSDPSHPVAMQLVSNSGVANAIVERDVSFDARGKYLSFWLRSEDANLFRFSVDLIVGGRDWNVARFGSQVIRTSLYDPGRWKYVTVPMAHLAPSGNLPVPTDDKLSDVRKVRIDFAPNASVVATVQIADLRLHDMPVAPGVVWYFDDCRADTYTNVFPLFAAKGWQGCVAVVQNQIGTVNKMTLAQAQEMHAAGWDMASHSKTHPATLAGLTVAEIDTELRDSYAFLRANGLTRGSRHFVYPAGGWDTNVLTETLRHYTSARSYNNTVAPAYEVPFATDPALIRGYGPLQGFVHSTITGYMDRAVARGGILVLTWHSVVDSPTQGNSSEVATADFAAMLDYAETIGLACYRPSDLGWA